MNMTGYTIYRCSVWQGDKSLFYVLVYEKYYHKRDIYLPNICTSYKTPTIGFMYHFTKLEIWRERWHCAFRCEGGLLGVLVIRLYSRGTHFSIIVNNSFCTWEALSPMNIMSLVLSTYLKNRPVLVSYLETNRSLPISFPNAAAPSVPSPAAAGNLTAVLYFYTAPSL